MPACKLTPKIETAVLNNVAAGAPLYQAAREAGVTAQTVRRWVELGNKGEKPYQRFVESLDKAEASPRVKALRCWNQAIDDGDWKAAERKLRYMDERQDAPANLERHLEMIFDAMVEQLGADQAKKVFSAIVERDSLAAAGGTGATLRLLSAG